MNNHLPQLIAQANWTLSHIQFPIYDFPHTSSFIESAAPLLVSIYLMQWAAKPQVL
ncbi:hypothetical protein CPC08DRAFT_713047 [Agrocybe pediades]|nr:hypothetical protein CPC08DRAFT_713047 [Agrocybe pediades]